MAVCSRRARFVRFASRARTRSHTLHMRTQSHTLQVGAGLRVLTLSHISDHIFAHSHALQLGAAHMSSPAVPQSQGTPAAADATPPSHLPPPTLARPSHPIPRLPAARGAAGLVDCD
eukprot:7388693-Prymnesium_polylepis.1